MLSDDQVKEIQPAIAAFFSYVTSPTDEQKDLIQKAQSEGLVTVRARWLVSWTDKGIERVRAVHGFS